MYFHAIRSIPSPFFFSHNGSSIFANSNERVFLCLA